MYYRVCCKKISKVEAVFNDGAHGRLVREVPLWVLGNNLFALPFHIVVFQDGNVEILPRHFFICGILSSDIFERVPSVSFVESVFFFPREDAY